MLKKQFEDTFSHLHASGNTVQEVLTMAHSDKTHPRTPSRVVTLVATLAILLSLAVAASAAGLLPSLITRPSPSQDPSQSLAEIYGDPTSQAYAAQQFLGEYTCSVEGSITLGENTITLNDFIMGGDGIGSLTFTVQNPNGVSYTRSGSGDIRLEGGLGQPRLSVKNDLPLHDGIAHSRLLLLQENKDGTTLELVMYFGLERRPSSIHEPLYLEFSDSETHEQVAAEITPITGAPVWAMQGSNGKNIGLSDLGMSLVWDEPVLQDIRSITLHFSDGSTWTVLDENTNNTLLSFWRTTTVLLEDGSYGIGRYQEMVLLFDRLIDMNQVGSITVEYIDPELAQEAPLVQVARYSK